jgi:hypothetical protein
MIGALSLLRGDLLLVLGGLPDFWADSLRIAESGYQAGCETMAVSVMMAHLGDAELASDVRAAVEHALADYAGDWRVSVIGSQANDRWELRVEGPNLFERSYVLEGTAREHRPEVIRVVLNRMLPKKTASA